MDKKQAEQLVDGYIITYFPEAKRELAQIKTISDPREQYNKADASHSKHSYYCIHAQGLCNVHNLSISGVYEYNQVVKELYNLRNEALKKKQGNQCLFCQKAGLTNPYVHERDNYGYSKVFCNQSCFTKWNAKSSEYTCEFCKQKQTGRYWYNKVVGKNGRESVSRNQKRFCSEKCLNYWKENQAKENRKKTCIGTNCSNQLTKNDVLYCQACINKNEQAFRDAQRTGEELSDMARDFQNKLTCPHDQIVYEENNPYFWFCEDCDDDSSPMFINKLQEELLKELNEDYFVKYSLTVSDLNNTSSQFTKLSKKEFVNQKQISQAFQAIEQELKQLSNNPNNKQRESKNKEREQLQQAINNLTNKPNKTPQEEQDLINKKKDLENLNNQNSELPKDKNNWLKPALIIGTITIIAIVLIYLIAKPKKKKP